MRNYFSAKLEELENDDFAEEELLNLKNYSGVRDILRSATLSVF